MFKRFALLIAVNVLIMITINIAIGVLGALGFRVLPDAQMNGLLIFCFLYGMGGSFISLWLSKFFAKRLMGVEIIDPNTSGAYSNLVATVHRLARNSNLTKMPEVGIYESEEVNAFATGPSRSNSMVAVSTGLLRRLDQEQVEAVLGHEVSHIANGDMVTMTLIQGVINAFVMFFARIASRIIAQALDEKARFWVEYLVYIVVSIAFTMLGAIVVNYFSRRREFRADAGSARLLGPQKMISALQALASNKELIDTQTQSAATLKISDRPTRFSIFATHPPIEDRIRALQDLAAS
jgi:heat shock protein HtpX